MPETIRHIMQVCPITHGMRIHRHDAVVDYLCRAYRDNNIEFHKEFQFKVGVNIYRPDIISIRKNISGESALVVSDVAICDGVGGKVGQIQ